MEPFAIVSDLHFNNWTQFSTIEKDGVNNRLKYIGMELIRAADTLDKYGGKTIYCAGDLFHKRGQIEPSVFNPVVNLFETLIDRGLSVRMIPGNHDLASEHSNDLNNAFQVLSKVGCEVNTMPVYFKDHKMLMVPWMPDTKEVNKYLDKIGNKKEIEYAICHAPLNGVLSGIPDNGLNPEEVEDYGFRKLFVGHYHNHRNFNDTVYSVGALTHQTWNDVGSLAGFIIVDDEGKVHHHPSSAPKFIEYNKDAKVKGNYVRVSLDEATHEEVEKIKKDIVDKGARGCVVKFTPKKTNEIRSFSIKSGTSTLRSITEFVDNNTSEFSSNVDALKENCIRILQEANED